ncbi:MAG TPA: polyamine aminopropyltransferase [Rhodothermales bacterium]
MEHKTFQTTYTEFWRGRSGLSFGVEKVLFDDQSPYQRVQVLQTDACGRLLTLDGLVMLTEWDEFVYHEMISHPALCVLSNPRRVLVIGGGDGGTVREVLKHDSVEHVDLVEIDQMVVDVSREFFPSVAERFGDPRLTLHVRDGVEFVRDAPADSYDVVIVDSTDPVDFAEALFGEAFYRDCARILREDGILISQSESPFDPFFRETLTRAFADLSSILPVVRLYLAHIPTYPMGTWSFLAASKKTDILGDFDRDKAQKRIAPFASGLQYYTADVHIAAFALPAFVQRIFV